MNLNKLAILTTVFNHTNNPYFNKNWNRFTQELEKLGCLNNLFVCEILPEKFSSQVNHINDQTYTINNSDQIWHKECGINFLLKQISDSYTKILVLDNDILFFDDQWIYDVYNMLDEYISVQPFDSVAYLLHDEHSIDYIDTGMVKNTMQSYDFPNGNPGLAFAYNREYLEYNNGLYNSCLVGGGDMINIAPFFIHIDNISNKIPNCVFRDEERKKQEYIEKCKNYILQNSLKPCNYLHNTAYHMFHGYRSDRQYNTRFNIINEFKASDTVIFDNDFYKVIDDDFHQLCIEFFQNRLSLKPESEPTIICSCKYGADSSNVFWLNKQSVLYTYNIHKIKLTINNKFQLQKYQILVNNINYNPTIDSDYIIIEATAPQSIEITCDKSISVPPDIRELCFFIESIDITNKEGQTVQYKLENIL